MTLVEIIREIEANEQAIAVRQIRRGDLQAMLFNAVRDAGIDVPVIDGDPVYVYMDETMYEVRATGSGILSIGVVSTRVHNLNAMKKEKAQAAAET